MAVTLSSTAAPRTIQAVLGCGTKNCSSASQAHEYLKQQFPTSQPARAAALLLRAVSRCTMGCDMAAPYTEGQDVGSVNTEGVSLGALSASAAREALGTSGDKRRRGDMDTCSGFRGEDLIDMLFEKMADKYERTLKAAGFLRYMLTCLCSCPRRPSSVLHAFCASYVSTPVLQTAQTAYYPQPQPQPQPYDYYGQSYQYYGQQPVYAKYPAQLMYQGYESHQEEPPPPLVSLPQRRLTRGGKSTSGSRRRRTRQSRPGGRRSRRPNGRKSRRWCKRRSRRRSQMLSRRTSSSPQILANRPQPVEYRC